MQNLFSFYINIFMSFRLFKNWVWQGEDQIFTRNENMKTASLQIMKFLVSLQIIKCSCFVNVISVEGDKYKSGTSLPLAIIF